MSHIEIFNSWMPGETKPMRRCYIYLAVFISIMTMPVSALAENAAVQMSSDAPSLNRGYTPHNEGFYIDLPEVTYSQLIGIIRTYQASLTQRKEKIAKYLDGNRLDAKDVLITAIMPGGLIYAAVRKGNLEQARTELVQINEDMHELSRDLLTMQAFAGELTVAQLK